jgi:hypothetical protein
MSEIYGHLPVGSTLDRALHRDRAEQSPKAGRKEIDRYIAVSNLLYPRQFPVDILVKT